MNYRNRNIRRPININQPTNMVEKIIDYITDLFELPNSTNFFQNEFATLDDEGKQINKKQRIPKLFYGNFEIENFKGIEKVNVRIVKDDLVLLLGLNESGKTTILRGIEAFDFRNDPDKTTNPNYFTSIRRKSEVDFEGQSIIRATINLESNLPLNYIKSYNLTKKDIGERDIKLLEEYIKKINNEKKITISRVFNFSNGQPSNYYYRIEDSHDFCKTKTSFLLATEIIKICPQIIYFEDFKDRIPEKIYINPKSDSYDHIWYDILDGLFFNAKSSYTIGKFKEYHENDGSRDADAKTVLRKVNMELNKVFTKRWKRLSGVKQIADTTLEYNSEKEYFQIKIYDNDGTNFSIDERSKGALWYLSFLMKTEFRSKKLRMNSGKPVYLIDEPASNLHSTAQTNMINNFIRLVQDTAIIYTTHSQYLISYKSIKNTYIIERNGKGTVAAKKWSDFIKSNVPNVKYYQPLANLLNRDIQK